MEYTPTLLPHYILDGSTCRSFLPHMGQCHPRELGLEVQMLGQHPLELGQKDPSHFFLLRSYCLICDE